MLKLRRGRLALVAAFAALSVVGVSSAASAHINPLDPFHNTPAHIEVTVGDVVDEVCDDNPPPNGGLSGQLCDTTFGLTAQVGNTVFGLGAVLFGPTGVVAQVLAVLDSLYDQTVNVVGFDPVDVVFILIG